MITDQQRSELGVAMLRVRDYALLNESLTTALTMSEQVDEGDGAGIRQLLMQAKDQAAEAERLATNRFYELTTRLRNTWL